MAEKWKLQDSARVMARKYNDTVDELNQSIKDFQQQQKDYSPTEQTAIEINDGLSNDDLDKLLGLSK